MGWRCRLDEERKCPGSSRAREDLLLFPRQLRLFKCVLIGSLPVIDSTSPQFPPRHLCCKNAIVGKADGCMPETPNREMPGIKDQLWPRSVEAHTSFSVRGIVPVCRVRPPSNRTSQGDEIVTASVLLSAV